MEDIKLIFPGGFYYECESCGGCCRRNWQIPVETPGKIESLEKFAIENGITETPLIDEPRRSGSDSAGGKILNLRGGKGCVFLDDKNLCRVHARLGSDAKPLMCQTFPFKPVELPGRRYYIRFSFACPSVRKNLASHPSVASYADMVSGYIKQGVVSGEIKDFPVWFAMPHQENATPLLIDEETLDYLNEEMIFRRMSRSFSGKFFTDVWRLLWDMAKLSSRKGENLVSKETIKVVSDGYDAKNNQERIPPRSVGKKNLYYAIFAGYEFVGREETAPMIKMRNLINLVRGKGELKTKYGCVDLKRSLQEVRFASDDNSAELLKRYFRHLVESGWMLIRPSDGLWNPTVLNSWALLALFYGLIVRFAKIFASLEGRFNTTFSDIDRALEIVEIEYVSHISRSWLFLDRRVFAKIFSALAESPDFVPVILSDED